MNTIDKLLLRNFRFHCNFL